MTDVWLEQRCLQVGHDEFPDLFRFDNILAINSVRSNRTGAFALVVMLVAMLAGEGPSRGPPNTIQYPITCAHEEGKEACAMKLAVRPMMGLVVDTKKDGF